MPRRAKPISTIGVWKMSAKSASSTMTKFSVDSMPNVGVATASVMCSSAAMTRGITTKCANARPAAASSSDGTMNE